MNSPAENTISQEKSISQEEICRSIKDAMPPYHTILQTELFFKQELLNHKEKNDLL